MSYRTKSGRLSKAGEFQVERTRVFAETFLTYAGESELCGQPYRVSDWLMQNIWRPLFGTGEVDKATGRFRRRYRRVLIGVHRAFGKSQLAACLVLTIATMEPLPNGQYGIVADSKENTAMVKSYIATIINANETLKSQWKVYKDVIRNIETGQEIHVYPYKEAALQGKHFHVLIGDEIHVWRDDAVWKAGTSGQAKIWNAVTIGITTAGSSRDGFLFKLYQKLKRDKHAFVCWLGITDQDNPADRRTWRKITAAGRITMEELEEQYESDKLEDGTPGPGFVRYYLNRTPMDAVEEPFMRGKDVDACKKLEPLGIDHDSWYTVGIDGAVRGDTLAVVCAQRQGERWAFEEYCWEKPALGQSTYDLTEVADVLLKLAADYGGPFICADLARMQFLTNWLERTHGLVLAEVAQTPSIMCPASELLARAVSTKSASFANVEVLPEHCKNAVAAESKAYGRRLASYKGRHGQGTKRIDAAVAAAMAMWAFDNNESESPNAWSIDLYV